MQKGVWEKQFLKLFQIPAFNKIIGFVAWANINGQI